MGSSRTRARTRVACIGRRILNHCATREALCVLFFDEPLLFKQHLLGCYVHWSPEHLNWYSYASWFGDLGGKQGERACTIIFLSRKLMLSHMKTFSSGIKGWFVKPWLWELCELISVHQPVHTSCMQASIICPSIHLSASLSDLLFMKLSLWTMEDFLPGLAWFCLLSFWYKCFSFSN